MHFKHAILLTIAAWLGDAPLAQAQAQVAPVQMAVTCPADARPGDCVAVTMGGQQLTVQVPEGVQPGGVFMVQPPVMAVATAVPIHG